MDRRGFLKAGLALGCSTAAAPLLTPLHLFAASGERRLVVIVLRGAMDGLGVFPPMADKALLRLRPNLAPRDDEGFLSLDGRFGMDPRLAPLDPLWAAGELAVLQAVATPYRDKRSHFDGQDLLETGAAEIGALRDGWLNRAVALAPGAREEETLSVGRDSMLLTSGAAPFRSWSPGERLALTNDERGLLTRIYARDPLFSRAAAMAADLTGGGEAGEGAAGYAARRLSEEVRIAAFSLGGWDTHASQRAALQRPLTLLAQSLVALKAGLGAAWGETLVIALTEFGRTARENGARGTDHGSGGAAILAGGAIRGGRVYGAFTGLEDDALYQGRDLTPTDDVRRHAAWALSAQFGIGRSALETMIFPGLDMGSRPGWLA